MSLAWLNKAQVVSTEEEVKKVAVRARREANPTNADIRVFKDGSVYPSAALVEKYQLEYPPKGAENPGNGFDVFDSDRFKQYLQGFEERTILAIPVSRKEGKLDLFQSTEYAANEEGGELLPKSQVMSQGAKTFGEKVLIPMLKEVYGLEFTEGVQFIDLKLIGPNDAPFQPGKVVYVPKEVTRGDKKGTPTVVRRENPDVWVLYPASRIEGDTISVPEDEYFNVDNTLSEEDPSDEFEAPRDLDAEEDEDAEAVLTPIKKKGRPAKT